MPTCTIRLLLHITLVFTPTLALLNVPEQIITIDLSTSDQENRTQTVFTTKVNLSLGDVIIDVTNATSNNGFFIVQAHSFQYNVSLSKTTDLKPGTYVHGNNVGLVESPLATNTWYRFYLNCFETANVEVLLAVVVYRETDPIPGGCNMVYNTPYAPYQIITYDENMITVNAAPAKSSSCDVVVLPRLDMYQLYLDEGTFDQSSYFNGIMNVLTVQHIKTYGTKVSDSAKHLPLRRFYAAYRGTGTVFAIIATRGNSSSAYVPAVSFACDVNNWEVNCLGPVSPIWKFLCAFIVIMGAFVCFFGHTFFKLTNFFFAVLFGSFIFYIAINVNSTSVNQNMGYSLLFGLAFGIFWQILWCGCGIPILSVSVSVIFIGYIISCIVFHMGLADLHILQSNINYWCTALCIILPLTLLLLLVTQFANILACSVVGATAVIIGIDHYVGGSIHYIILNNIRRAIVPNFNRVILDPPFQYKDIILSFGWIGLVFFGLIIQRKQQRGKPPFPPHIRSFTENYLPGYILSLRTRSLNEEYGNNERTSLLPPVFRSGNGNQFPTYT